jgi:hypothetical protein
LRVLDCTRQVFPELCKVVFSELELSPVCLEIGVLRGSNAELIYKTLKPQTMHLIDLWQSGPIMEKIGSNAHRHWVSKPENAERYYGGPLDEQKTFDRLFDEAKNRFLEQENVKFYRGNSVDKLIQLRHSIGKKSLDYAYIDGAHDFEAVFDDLMYVEPLLKDNSFLQLNDCCFSAKALQQNIGVLEAVSKFIKLKNFQAIALTKTDFTDLLLCPKDSVYKSMLNNVIDRAGVGYFEIPSQLLPSLNVSVNRNEYACLSFV